MRAYADSRPDMINGVDLNPPYYLLRPYDTKKIYIDDQNFAVSHDGVYRYQMSLPYYHCHDIFDLAHKPKKFFLQKRWFKISGSFSWSAK